MKKTIIACLLLTFSSSLYSAAQNEKVLLYIRGTAPYIDVSMEKEVAVMIEMLEEAGFTVIVATTTGDPIKDNEGKGIRLKPDMDIGRVRIRRYLGIILPCMALGRRFPTTEEISLVKEAVAHGIPLAAQHYATVILAQAGALDGKKYAVNQPTFIEGGIYGGQGVIKDGNIITASHDANAVKLEGGIDTTGDLTRIFIETIQETMTQ